MSITPESSTPSKLVRFSRKGSKIRNDLSAATKVSQEEIEDTDVYLERLASAAIKLDELAWDDLTLEAQEWVNSTMESVAKGGKPIPLPDLSEYTPDLSATFAEKAPVATTGDKNISLESLRKLVIAYPEASRKDIENMVKKEGLKLSKSSLHTIYYESRAIMTVLQKYGILNKLDASKALLSFKGKS